LRFVGVVLLIGGIVCAGTSVSAHFLSVQANGTEQADRATSKTPEKDESKTDRAATPTVKQDRGQATGDSKVRALQKERLAAFKEIVAEIESLGARVPLDDLLHAKRQVLHAEFELCESDKERVEVLAKLVAVAKELEAVVAQRFKDMRVVRRDLLKAKADRLEAEIALERAKDQAAGQPK
jgi:hypothetical protein